MGYKIVSIIGARPQFIKASAMSRAMAQTGSVQDFIVHTGQHFDQNMSQVFFEQMQIPRPDVNLSIHSLGHGAMTGRMLEAAEKVLLQEKPDAVLVYGDTNSTLAGALAAAKLHIPLAHVEAGLRSFNMKMPEELNRTLTDRISQWLFCPTDDAVRNLKNEGIAAGKIYRTGDIMYDSALYYAEKSVQPPESLPPVFALLTMHRAENTDDPKILRSLINTLGAIAEEMPIVWPIHPRTKARIIETGIRLPARIVCIEPLGYLEMLWVLQECTMVFTDSGGLQKEAYFFGKPCITLRPETEWTELEKHAVNKVCGHDEEQIMGAFHSFLNKKPSFPEQLYGDGKTAEKILQIILNQ